MESQTSSFAWPERQIPIRRVPVTRNVIKHREKQSFV